MLKKRIIAFLAAAAITAALTLGITAAFPTVFTAGSIEEGLCYEATGIRPDAVVVAVDGNTASADFYYYMLTYACANMDSVMRYYTGSGIVWDMELSDGKTVGELVREEALTYIKQQLVIENLAEQYGVSLSESDLAELAEVRAQTVEALGGEEAYLAEIAKLGLREETYERIMTGNYLYNDLLALYHTPGSKLYVEDAVLMNYASELGYITADHILLSTLDENRQPHDEETAAQKRAQAEELLARLQTCGGDVSELFAQLADEYSEDPGRAYYPDGYTFTEGEMTEVFDTAAREIAEGEFSQIVESEFGFHIILRKPLDASASELVRDGYFDRLVMEAVDGAKLTASAALDAVDPQSAYEALLAAQ